MKDWEFLMQKAGDRHWRSFPPSTQEIEAARYRIVAHTGRTNVAVEVKITYEDASGVYAEQYSRYTNSEGLLIILPWTDLQPGRWRASCCCDIMGELLGEFWKKNLQLYVLPAVASIVFPQLDSEEEDPATGSITLPPAVQNDVQQPSMKPSLVEFDSELELSLTLDQQTFIRESGALPISGQIALLSGDDSSWELLAGTLRYQLRDPKTGQVLLNIEQHLSKQSLPLSFSTSLELLPEWESCLLLGEVILEVPSEAIDGAAVSIPVASQPFTITANLEQLLESVQVLEHQNVAQTQKTSTPLSEMRPLHLFDPRKSQTNRIMRFRPSSGQILPPRISHATTKNEQPQLPKFSVLKSTPVVPHPEETPSRREEMPPPYPVKVTTAVLLAHDEALVSDRAAVDRDFEALNQERFWSRLNLLSSSNDEPSTEEPSRE